VQPSAAGAVAVAVTTAGQPPVVAAPVRSGQSRRTSFSADSDAAPGSATTVDRPLPGHRMDVAATSTTSAGPRVAADQQPAGLGMVGADRVAKAREQTAARPMQRLSIELDDARVAIRVRGDKVSVDVTSDPKGALGEGWARQVERTIDRAVRSQEPDSRGTDAERQPGSQGRRQPHEQHRGQPRDRHQNRQFEIGAWNFEPTIQPNLEGAS
jgi:hypothetical protein